MKGQNRLFMELMIFTIGIFILAFVSNNFTNVGTFIGESSIDLQSSGVLNILTSSIAKVSISENSKIDVSIPNDFSGLSYNITLTERSSGSEHYRLIITTNDNQTFTKKIFKQPSDYNINIESGVIDSSAESITIRKIGKNIIIERV